MNPVRGIETNTNWLVQMNTQTFQINESRSRDWNRKLVAERFNLTVPFKLMNPVRGIETPSQTLVLYGFQGSFQINESRSRDWNDFP